VSVVGRRIPLQDIADRLRSVVVALGLDVGPNPVTVGTLLDPDYTKGFVTQYNKIWVGGERMRPIDNMAGGLTERARQNMRVEILIQPVVQRLPPASVTTVDVETRLSVLENVINQAMFGWKHAIARYPFGFLTSIDGPAYEPISTLNITFGTQIVYQSNP
jgi:hypothetical protein